jgi:thiol-disulfide isomerase/thioredoxin
MKSFLPAFLATLIIAFALPARAGAPIYPDVAHASGDIAAAQQEAARTHRRVLVDFGGNWCTDCKVLDINMRKPENAALLAERYGIPLKKGVPALAVLDSDGRVVYAQKNGEFESMRHMDPASVHQFLEKWAR